ncbi:sodium/proline symporter [Virgibacillus natechei]|uniref:Sodium/proline symporter n=1 Tax=Virgibacillus natechei TaxID=1216297 RepID=A0ABS4IGJ6_9BACI|nr:sodium/proline symporter [Virgibacillus natechei]MBP1970050.1 sodium/proline symporter [Virgibacillus natechei]UZD14135.1 sodium/proline symporter [Virgibacillus natechei]
MNLDIIVFFIYLLSMLGIGLYFTKKASASADHYLLGNRKIGAPVTAISMQSSSMSGFMFMGGPAQAFQEGWHALWYAIGDAGGSIVNLSVLGKRMRRMSQLLGALSPVEYLEKRFESTAVRVYGAAVAIIFLFAYAFAQFIAAGKALETMSGFSYELALVIGIGVIVVYTVAGGYLAVAFSGFVQGVIMLIGVSIIGVMVLPQVGGLSGLNEQLAAIDPTYLSIWGKDLIYYGQWGVILGAVLIYAIGYMGLPHVSVKHMSMEGADTTKNAILWSAGFNQLFTFTPYILGLSAIIIMPNISDPEMVIPEMVYMLFPGIAAAILLSAIMAAIMSTCDALLMQAGTTLSRDVYSRFINKKASHKQQLLVSRLCILIGGVIGIVVAVYEPPSVFALVVFAFGVLGNTFMIPYIASVYSKNANKIGVLSAMVGGSVTNIAWELFTLQNATGIHPFLAGLLISLIAMLIGNKFGTPPSDPILDAFDLAKQNKRIPKKLEKGIFEDLAPEARNISYFLETKEVQRKTVGKQPKSNEMQQESSLDKSRRRTVGDPKIRLNLEG